jgi:hypothetical protein
LNLLEPFATTKPFGAAWAWSLRGKSSLAITGIVVRQRSRKGNLLFACASCPFRAQMRMSTLRFIAQQRQGREAKTTKARHPERMRGINKISPSRNDNAMSLRESPVFAIVLFRMFHKFHLCLLSFQWQDED